MATGRSRGGENRGDGMKGKWGKREERKGAWWAHG